MDNVNRIISFILGLIVVVVFIAIVAGKFNLGKIKTLTKSKTTPTVTPKLNKIPVVSQRVTITYPDQRKTTYSGSYNSASQPTPTQVKIKVVPSVSYGYQAKSTTQITENDLSTIPNTGSPTFMLPLAFSMLVGGAFLKKYTAKN
jgi:hypothetical protein